MTDWDKENYDFQCKGIFERRKTQYTFLLFYLGVCGACSSIILGSKEPSGRLGVLLAPIILQLPVCCTWWYQRNQIFRLDEARKRIIEKKLDCKTEKAPGWQDLPGKYANDLVLMFTPICLISLTPYITKTDSSSKPFKTVFYLAFFSCLLTLTSFAFAGIQELKITTGNVKPKCLLLKCLGSICAISAFLAMVSGIYWYIKDF